MEHEEGGLGVEFAFGHRDHPVFRLVEAVGGHHKCILQPVRHQQGAGVEDVALLDHQLDDGGRGDGVEAAGGRVVEQQVRLGDDGAGDGHAAAHASGELRGVLVDGVIELDEAQHLENAAVDLLGRDVLFDQPVGDVVADGHRVEERAFLEDHADAVAEGEEVLLGHGVDLLAEDVDAPGVGQQESVGELEQHALAASRGTEHDARLARHHLEGDVLQDLVSVEGDGNVVEDDHRVGGRGSCRFDLRIGRGCHRYRPKSPIMKRLMTKSEAMISTEETTTAWVVERPTPCVPPLVFMP